VVPNPVLIRIDTKSGHGSSNLSKAIESTADQYAFTWYNMGVVPPMVKKGICKLDSSRWILDG
jgi:prolyl oligopeptidase